MSTTHTNEFDNKANYPVAVFSNKIATNMKKKINQSEAKLLYYMISKIKRADVEIPLIVLNTKELCCVIDRDPENRKNCYDVRQMLFGMTNAAKACFAIEVGNGWTSPLPWIDRVFIEKDSDLIIVMLSRELAPFLLQLKKSFFCVNSAVTYDLNSNQATSLYALAKSKAYKRETTIDVQEFKDENSIDQKGYEKFSNFFSKVLLPAQEEINAKTDIAVTLSPITEKRQTKSVGMSIRENEKNRNMLRIKVQSWEQKIEKYRPSEAEELKIRKNFQEELDAAANRNAANRRFCLWDE